MKKIFLFLGLAVSIQSATAMTTTKNGITKFEDEKKIKYSQESVKNVIESAYFFKKDGKTYASLANIEKYYAYLLENPEAVFQKLKEAFDK